MKRMTKRDLVKVFKERGLRANRLLGQNFLVDHNVLQFICNAAALDSADVVLEIGAGTGLLTGHLAGSGAAVVAVEIDEDLFEIARDYLEGSDRVTLVFSDIHGRRREIHADVRAALEREMIPGRRLKVVSNLPYCISSDLVVSLLEMPWPVETMVLTVQKEFADRLMARPGSREYSALTVLIQAQAEVERVRSVGTDVFWPVPKVGSTILRVRPKAELKERIREYALFKGIVAALFAGRRKTAAGALRGAPHPKLAKAVVFEAFRASGVDPELRADALSPDEVILLANHLAPKA